jgi:hypothetical protein
MSMENVELEKAVCRKRLDDWVLKNKPRNMHVEAYQIEVLFAVMESPEESAMTEIVKEFVTCGRLALANNNPDRYVITPG